MTRADIQLIRSLNDKSARQETGLFVAEGEKLVRELLASDFGVRKVYYTEGEWSAAFAERASTKEMERASRLKTAAGCLALVEIPRREPPSRAFRRRSETGRLSPVGEAFDPAASSDGLTLALDGVQNPGNLGTIIRLADWFGIRDILCSADCADCWSPKVVQATMGAITRVWVHYGNLEEMIGKAEESVDTSGTSTPPPVYGTFLEGENIYGAALSATGVIVLGSEGRGISAGVERIVTRKLFIPPFPSRERGSESLNVAVAAAIVCSEFRRRWFLNKM